MACSGWWSTPLRKGSCRRRIVRWCCTPPRRSSCWTVSSPTSQRPPPRNGSNLARRERRSTPVVLTQITTWFLEMTSPDRLKPGRSPEPDILLMRVGRPSAEVSRFFYRAVGGNWYWIDRIEWTYAEWQAWAESVETWVAYLDGTPAGY